jgi:hypothetical protein
VSAEILQFAVVLGGIAIVVALWLMFVYKPRRTGEGGPRGAEPEGEPPKDEGPARRE